jgi:hypothetical protein
MDPIDLGQNPDRTGLIYRLNAGYRFRIGGGNAHNDGIQAEMDIGYQSRRFFDGYLSIETGSSLDLFGETEHLGAYFQLNLHYRDHWIFSARAMGAGINDDKEQKNSPTPPSSAPEKSEDSDDFGGAVDLSLMAAYRLDRNFLFGLRAGYHLQAYGNGGTDQGTQHSLATLLNLAYQF